VTPADIPGFAPVLILLGSAAVLAWQTTMPKPPASNTIAVAKAHSLRQLATLAKDFPTAPKRAPVDVASQRGALQKAKAPLAYALSDRVSLLAQAGIEFNAPADELSLSVRSPYVEGAGGLYFFNVSDYLTDQNRVALFMSKLGGGSFFAVTVHGAAPRARYLLDISVSGAPGLTLTSITGGTSATADSKGHALIVLAAGSSSDLAISLTVNGVGMYNFHNVVVSRI